jgi:glycerol-3-phosphate acyltransferase PlsY
VIFPLAPVLILVLAYLLGSIPFGLIMAKLFAGRDIRKSGSGNIGATNVARVVGPAAGLLTLLCDAGKGWLSVWLAARCAHGEASFAVLAGLLVMLGHCFPVWLGFRGGKGVATAAGVFAALCPPAMLAAAVLFLLVVVFWRYVSLASIAAAAAIPLLVYLLWAPRFAPPTSVTLVSFSLAVLVIFQHRANIARLARGQEPKFSFRNKDAL